MEKKPVKCLQCKHYYVTWDQNHPHGCRAYHFKSPTIPSQLVKRESGQDCMLYSPRPTIKASKIDLNDENNW